MRSHRTSLAQIPQLLRRCCIDHQEKAFYSKQASFAGAPGLAHNINKCPDFSIIQFQISFPLHKIRLPCAGQLNQLESLPRLPRNYQHHGMGRAILSLFPELPYGLFQHKLRWRFT